MEKISHYQLFVLIIYYQLGTTILTGFASGSGRDGWISSLVSLGLGLLIISIYLWLFTLNPKLNFIEWYQKELGSVIGTFIAWQYPLLFIYYIGRIVVDVDLLIGNLLLPYTSFWLISLIFLILIAYIVYSGINTIGKLGEVLFPVIISLFLLEIILLHSGDLVHYDNILPITDNGWSKIIETVIPTGITQTYGQALEFSFLWILMDKPKKVWKTTLLATFTSGLLITMFEFYAICVLGEALFKSSIFPMYTLIQQISVFEFIEKLDALGILYVTTTMVFKTSIHLYVLTKMIQTLTYTKRNQTFIIPSLIISLFVGLTMSSNPVEHFYIAFKRFSHYLWIYTLFLYPLILLIVTLIRRQTKKQKPRKGNHL